jgi:hypothetical protein
MNEVAGGEAFHDETKAKGSTVISMKNDWKRIFDWEKSGGRKRRTAHESSHPRLTKDVGASWNRVLRGIRIYRGIGKT